jgi:hypothetical protein
MTNSSKTLKKEKNKDWVLIQAGLFDYPVKEGQYPALLANRCTSCGKSFFPKRTLCPHCFEQGEMEDITLERRGVIYTCTVIHIPSPTGIQAPYAYGYVDIPANNIRVFALFTGADPYSFRSGQEVVLVLEPIKKEQQGQQIIGYKFKPLQ